MKINYHTWFREGFVQMMGRFEWSGYIVWEGILPREAGEVIQTWTKDNLNGKAKQQKEVLMNWTAVMG